MTDIYTCKRGDMCLIGDSYGYDMYVCVQDKHSSKDYPFPVVSFLTLEAPHYIIEMGYDSHFGQRDYCELRGIMSEKEILNVESLVQTERNISDV